MIRSSLVSSLLIVFTLSFVHPFVATADPIVTSAMRRVLGFTGVPETQNNNTHFEESHATSGVFFEHVEASEIEGGGSAIYVADQNTLLSSPVIGGTGSVSATIEALNPGATAKAYGESLFFTNFTLDGNYDFVFSGSVSASSGTAPAYSNAGAYLLSNVTQASYQATTSNGSVPFYYFGTLGAGTYYMELYAYSYQQSDSLKVGNAAFNGVLTLSPTAAVPDGGDTAILFLLGSALLGAFALRVRRQT
jgi:hypothetical protein